MEDSGPSFDLRSHLAAPPVRGGAAGGADPWLVGLGVALVFAVVLWVAWRGGVSLLSKKLAAAGWVLYLQAGCSACTKQMKVLGGSYHRYIVCNRDGSTHGGYTRHPPLPCAGLRGAPYWYNEKTGQHHAGLLEAPALYELLRETKK
jgi:hypothetical protein